MTSAVVAETSAPSLPQKAEKSGHVPKTRQQRDEVIYTLQINYVQTL